MAQFLQLVIGGIVLGSCYALIALGFTIIFKASGVINFAQGELVLVGAYVVSAGVFEYHLAFIPALLVGIVFTVLIGVVFERFILRRMIGRPVFSIIMITIGLDILLFTAVSVRIGAKYPPVATPFLFTDGIKLGGVSVLSNQMAVVAVTAACCVLLFVFFRYTKYGLAMRATALDQEAALAMGISVRTVNALAWGIAAAIATIGGVFLGSAQNLGFVSVSLGQVALAAFPAIILGGLDSVSGAVVGGLIIGLTETLVGGYESSVQKFVGVDFHHVAPYLLMIIVLLVRPYGLFGTRKVERV
jgi:branched-chain amino acid transport system permease protein